MLKMTVYGVKSLHKLISSNKKAPNSGLLTNNYRPTTTNLFSIQATHAFRVSHNAPRQFFIINLFGHF